MAPAVDRAEALADRVFPIVSLMLIDSSRIVGVQSLLEPQPMTQIFFRQVSLGSYMMHRRKAFGC